MTEYPVINRETLDALRVELGVHFPRILGYFAEDGVKSLEELEEAVRKRDAVALVRPAHTLKGESLQFGAERLAHAAEYIEDAARDGVEMRGFPLEIVEYGARLRSLFEEALTALQGEAASVAAAPAPIRRPAAGFGRKIG